jgi:hypothetical protein
MTTDRTPRNYLANSPVAWLSLALMIAGFSLKFVVHVTGLPLWLVPVGYFTALVSAGILFIGWVRFRIS